MLGQVSRLIAILTLFTLCQCRWNEPPASDTIVFALSSEPKTLDPRYSTGATGQRIGHLIFSSLIKVGPDLKLKGDIAESWTYENKVFRFQLKKNIVFHDGTVATAEDFRFSVDEFRKSSSPFNAQFKMIKDSEVRYTTSEGGELKLFLEDYSAPLIYDLTALKLLPKKIVEQQGDDFYKSPVGSGAFVFTSQDAKNILLTSNDNYYGTQPKIKKAHFKVIKDSNTRFQKMYKGQIDIIQSDIPFSKVDFFKKQKDFDVVVAPGMSTTYLLLNLRNPLLAKKEVRHAISSSINREELIKYSQEGYADPATSILTSNNDYFNKSLKYQTLNDDKIRELFSDIKEPIVLKTSNTQEAIANGRVIAHQLRSKGLPVEQRSYEWGTYYEDVKTGKFEIAVMKWVGVLDPDIYRFSLDSSMTPPGRNRGYYSNAEFDQLVRKGLKEENFERRKELYNKAQELVFEDLPTIPLWYEKQVAIVHKRVKDYYLPSNGDFSSLLEVYKNGK